MMKFIKVNVVRIYAIKCNKASGRSEINNWKLPEIIQKWFGEYPISNYHASRDSRIIDERAISAEEINGKEMRGIVESKEGF